MYLINKSKKVRDLMYKTIFIRDRKRHTYKRRYKEKVWLSSCASYRLIVSRLHFFLGGNRKRSIVSQLETYAVKNAPYTWLFA